MSSAFTAMKNSKAPSFDTGANSVSGSNVRFLNRLTLIEVPLVRSASVWPSAGAESTARAAAMPPPPALFSTTTRWPSFSPSFSATSREVVSPTPPGPKAMTKRMGWLG